MFLLLFKCLLLFLNVHTVILTMQVVDLLDALVCLLELLVGVAIWRHSEDDLSLSLLIQIRNHYALVHCVINTLVCYRDWNVKLIFLRLMPFLWRH